MQLLLNPEGTLIDSSQCLSESIDYACRITTGAGPRDDAAPAFPPGTALARALGVDESSEQVKEATLHCADFYLENWSRLATPYPGARVAVERLRSAGCRIVAVADGAHVAETLERLGIVVDDCEMLGPSGCPLARRVSTVCRHVNRTRDTWLTDRVAEWQEGWRRGIRTVLAGWGPFAVGIIPRSGRDRMDSPLDLPGRVAGQGLPNGKLARSP